MEPGVIVPVLVVFNPKLSLAFLVLLGTRWVFGLGDGPVLGRVVPKFHPVPPGLSRPQGGQLWLGLGRAERSAGAGLALKPNNLRRIGPGGC